MSGSSTAVNVKIVYKDKIKRRNGVKSLKELHQVVRELFKELHQKRYKLSYTDNEKDEVTIESDKCFEAATYSVYNTIHYIDDQIKKDSDNNDIRRKLVILKVKIHQISDVEAKYDDSTATINLKYKSLKFSWCSKMKGANIDLSEYDFKAKLREGTFHAVRGSIPIPKGSISEWELVVFIDRSTSGNFYGLVSSKVDIDIYMKYWYNHGQTEMIYGVDDNPSYIYEGGARIAPKWKTKAIPFQKETRLKFTADYTKNCCVLTVNMNGEWLYQFLLPPNQEWYPAVQFEEPGSWARIVI